MIEEWKELIEECPGFYISSFGNIKDDKGNIVFISDNYDRDDYPMYFFPRDKVIGFPGKRIHKLVAKYFIPNPDNKKHVNHKDFKKSNNHAENLEWTTPSENQIHMVKGGRHHGGWSDWTSDQRKGKNNPMYGKRFKCMNNEVTNKYVKLEEIDLYLKNNWKFGRIKKTKP